MPGGRGTAIVVMAVGLAACGSAAHAPTGPSPSPRLIPSATSAAASNTPAPTPSPTAAAATGADAAVGPYPLTREGAYALVQDFYRLQYQAALKRDTTEFDDITLPTCPCRALDKFVLQLREGHEHVDGEGSVNVKPFSFTASSVAAQVAVSHDVRGGTLVTNTGQVARVDAAAKHVVDSFILKAQAESWLVSSIERVSTGTP